MNKEAIKLIDRLYKDLYLDDEVLHHSSGNKYDKFNNIKEYLEKLESVHNRVSETGRHKNILKWMYYKKYVIKEEDIPDSYYAHQQEIALERGYGYVEITEKQKKEYQKEIIENQKKSLDTWLDYFLSEDAKVYPFWAKYWAFQGMIRLGNYNKQTGEFARRTKDTVAPFCDLNREALAMSIDLIIKLIDKEKIEDKDLEILVKSGSFKKIYEYILKNVLSDNKNIVKRNIGKWVKYEQGSNHMPLVASLKGYNTGWCTAGESTAENQLSMGDFYVYYTLDENNEYKVPRIAIRMEYGNIAEIRGVAPDQNLEPEMEEVVEEKIKDFPDKEEYYKKVNDMKLLTKIYNKHQNNEELTKEELSFLYELDEEIIGFGYDKDPRIEEILCNRNNRKDLANIFECREDQISFNQSEIRKDTIYHYSDLNMDMANIENYTFPKYVRGSLFLNNLTSSKGLVLPETVGGSLILNGLTSSKGLVLPETVGGSLDLTSLESLEGVKISTKIGEDLYLNNIKSANGVELPEKIGGDLYLYSLTSAKGLVLPKIVEGSLYLDHLKSVKNVMLPKKIGEHLDLDGLMSAEGLVLPETIGGYLYLSGLVNAKGLVLSKTNVESLCLDGLTSAEGLEFPETIQGDLFLSGLTSVDGLILPKKIRGILGLDGLTSVEGLELPETIGRYLSLRGLTSAKNLILPKTVDMTIYLDNLTNAENLVLPQKIGWYLDFKKLTSIDGLIIPDPLIYTIYMKGFEITPENVHEYRNNKNK